MTQTMKHNQRSLVRILLTVFALTALTVSAEAESDRTSDRTRANQPANQRVGRTRALIAIKADGQPVAPASSRMPASINSQSYAHQGLDAEDCKGIGEAAKGVSYLAAQLKPKSNSAQKVLLNHLNAELKSFHQLLRTCPSQKKIVMDNALRLESIAQQIHDRNPSDRSYTLHYQTKIVRESLQD